MQQINDLTEPIYRKQQDNKCPDCLYLDLEFKDTPAASNNSKGNFLNVKLEFFSGIRCSDTLERLTQKPRQQDD